jgi:hypothetical protein
MIDCMMNAMNSIIHTILLACRAIFVFRDSLSRGPLQSWKLPAKERVCVKQKLKSMQQCGAMQYQQQWTIKTFHSLFPNY